MARVVVEGRNVSMRFGGVLALDRVNFRLHDHELRCLIGPNGAGKSTFFKCLAGLHTPTSGDIRIGREQTTRWLPHQIAGLGVGIKMQVPSVMNQLSVYENVELPLVYLGRSKSDRKKTVLQILERGVLFYI